MSLQDSLPVKVTELTRFLNLSLSLVVQLTELSMGGGRGGGVLLCSNHTTTQKQGCSKALKLEKSQSGFCGPCASY